MAKVFHYSTVKLEEVIMEGALKTKVRWLITEENGAKNFAMRIFEIEASGQTPLHKHAWEHEVFILEGEGELFNGKIATPFKTGDAIFVPPNELHQFRNSSKSLLKFVCLIPFVKK